MSDDADDFINFEKEFNRPGLLQLVSELRPEWGHPRFVTIKEGDSDSGAVFRIETPNRIIFLISFDGHPSRWAAYIPNNLSHEEYDHEGVEYCLSNERRTLEFLAKEAPHLPVPRIHAYSLTSDAPVDVPFLILDWIEGSSLEPFTDVWPPLALRRSLLDDLSDFLLDLWACSVEGATDLHFWGNVCIDHFLRVDVPDGTPPGQGVSTEAWLTASLDRALRRNIRNRDIHKTIIYLVQRSMIPHMIVREYNHFRWVLAHFDLHAGNIIVDPHTLKLKGIIDWNAGVALPLQTAASWPKLLQYIPGWVPPGFSNEFMEHPNDKTIFLDMLRKKEHQRHGTEIYASVMESSYERQFFEWSFHIKAAHDEWEKRHPPSKKDFIAALDQLEIIWPRIDSEYHDHLIATRTELIHRLGDALRED